MNIAQLIEQKRDGMRMSREELAFLVGGYARGDVPDYQVAAWAMAVFFQGMTDDETADLTRVMIESGGRLQWPDRSRPKVDKHSTGGIGDKTSIIIAPLLACAGVDVPMISGRGLGATGGTLDKLESIPGYRTRLASDEFQSIVARIGCAIAGASQDLAPADRKLYALRDVTGTVPSIPLITGSILSKKLAAGLDGLVLDVKCGSGAFMKQPSQAAELARSLVRVSSFLGVPASALITDMNQPLGRMVGNAVEIDECVDVLQGGGPADVRRLSVLLAAEVLALADSKRSQADLSQQLERLIDSGDALRRLEQMVDAQGGRLDAPRRRERASAWSTPAAGYLESVHAELLGRAIIEMGGGRRTLGDTINPAVGLEMLARIGDPVEPGQPLVSIYCDRGILPSVSALLASAFVLADKRSEPPALVWDRVSV